MTEKDALEWIHKLKMVALEPCVLGTPSPGAQALDIAERAIKHAVKTPVVVMDGCPGLAIVCPVCIKPVKPYEAYCHRCGQALLWSEQKEATK